MRQTALKNPTVEFTVYDGEIVKPLIHLLRSPLSYSNVIGGTVTLKGESDTVIGQISASNDGNAVYTLDTSLLNAGSNEVHTTVETDYGEILLQKANIIKQ